RAARSGALVFCSPGAPLLPHSSPTRRSSDLVLVVGAGGQLGTALRAQFPDAEFVTRQELDITSDLTEARAWRQYSTIINAAAYRSEEHTSELQSRFDLVCRLLLEKKKTPATL